MGAFSQIRDGLAFAFSPPAVLELGVANGFDLQLQDRAGLGHAALMDARNLRTLPFFARVGAFGVDLMSASRGYQANVAAITSVKDMIARSIDLFR